MNWDRRYSSELNFEDMVNQTVQREADEKISDHGEKAEYHIRRAEDHEDKNELLFHLHTLAARAHDLAHHAWTHVYNNVDNPTGVEEYDAPFTQSLRNHARESTSHAEHASMVAEEMEDE